MVDSHTTMGSLILIAGAAGADLQKWRDRAQDNPGMTAATNDDELDLSRFSARARLQASVRHRPWIMPPILVAGCYTALAAAGGSGKTATAMLWTLALATGRSDLAGFPVNGTQRVIFLSGEDSPAELTRRLMATMQLHNIDSADLGDRLLLIGVGDIPRPSFNRLSPGGAVVDDAGINAIECLIDRHGATVLVIDPLASFLPGGVNDGASASAVAARLSAMCEKHRCAILLLHHVSKLAMRTGDTDASAATGSIMWLNHARVGLTLGRPTVEDTIAAGEPPSAQRDLLLLSQNKANLSRAADATWYRVTGVELPNAEPPMYPHGDMVGAAALFRPGVSPSLFSLPVIKQVMDRIEAGTAGGLPYRPTGRAGLQDYRDDIGAVLQSAFPAEDKRTLARLAKRVVGDLIGKGWLVEETRTIPRTGGGKGGGKSIPTLSVRWDVTPWGDVVCKADNAHV